MPCRCSSSAPDTSSILILVSTDHGQRKPARKVLQLLSALLQPACGGLFLHQPPGEPGYGFHKEITKWSRWNTGVLLPTELPTAPGVPYVIEMLPLIRPLPLCQAVIHQLVLVASIQPCNKPSHTGIRWASAKRSGPKARIKSSTSSSTQLEF